MTNACTMSVDLGGGDAVSQLHQLQTKKYAYGLEFTFTQPVPPLWAATGSIIIQNEDDTVTLRVTVDEAQSRQKKKDAKECTASQLLRVVQSYHLSKVEATIPNPSTITKKQERMLERAELEASTIRGLYAYDGQRSPTIMCIDLEVYEKSKEVLVLEIGIASTEYMAGCEGFVETRHLVIQEHLGLENTYTPNHRENFKIGTSEYILLDELPSRMQAIAERIMARNNPVLLVNCGVVNDVKWLAAVGINVFDLFPGLRVVDLGQAFMFMSGELQLPSLTKILGHYQYEVAEDEKHNGGMDAFHGILSVLSMAKELNEW